MRNRRVRPPGARKRLDVGAALAAWVDAVQRRAAAVLVAAAVLTAACLSYALTHLGINTSTAEMISERLDWRRDFIEFKKAFPPLTANVIVVIDGDTAELAAEAQRRLGAAIASQREQFRTVHLPGGGEFFERSAFLYAPLHELEELADRIAAAQPFLHKLSEDLSLGTLFSVMEQALDEAALTQGTQGLLEALSRAFAANNAQRFHRLSWQAVMSGDLENDARHRRLIVVQPELDFASNRPRRIAVERIRDTVAALELTPSHGIRVRLTGPIPMEFEELASVSEGTLLAGALSLSLVILLLLAGLRSVRLVAASVTTLIMGLIATAAFAALAVERLNLISIAFTVLYIGLAIDFSIHYCARYVELRDAGYPHADALVHAARDVGTSLLICAGTTAVGFYAFLPTDFSGVAQLGLISGTGMFVSFFATMTVLPALMTAMPPRLRRKRSRATLDSAPLAAFGRGVLRHRAAVRAAAIVSALAAMVLLGDVRFDDNPLHLRDPSSESVTTFQELLSSRQTTPLTLSVVTPTRQAADETRTRLTALETVAAVRGLDDLVPTNQPEKLAVIDEIALILGGALAEPQSPRIDSKSDIDSIARFAERLRRHLGEKTLADRAVAQALLEQMDRWLTVVSQMPAAGRDARAAELAMIVLGLLPYQLHALNSSLEARPIGVEDLPPDARQLWQTDDGRFRLEVVGHGDLRDDEQRRTFVSSVRAAHPRATGMAVVEIEAGHAVLGAFRFALLSAFAVIAIMVFPLLRRGRDAAAVLLQLALVALLTAAAATALGVAFNFANVIALPLLLGVAVDSAIHMAHRLRAAAPKDGNLLATSTGRAVVLSILTTTASFGSLAFSAHPGTASMGLLLTLGMGVALISTVTVLPALLGRPHRPARAVPGRL